MAWMTALQGANAASSSAGLQMGGNIGNKNIKSKGNRILFNALDFGGGLSQTINMLSGGKLFGEGDDEEMNLEDLLVYKQLPDYPEATKSREDWSKWLQDAFASGDYGATNMNWDEIFNTAKDKLNRYYWGGVNDSGLAGKLRASAARRGVSQSPALENQLSTLGFQNAIDLNELSTNLTSQKANYTESARKTWLNSLMSLASLKPSYITGNGVAQGVAAMYGDAQEGDTGMASIIGSLGKLFANSSSSGTTDTGNSSWLNNLLNSNVYGNSQNSLVSDYGSTYGMNSAYANNYLNNYNWN